MNFTKGVKSALISGNDGGGGGGGHDGGGGGIGMMSDDNWCFNI